MSARKKESMYVEEFAPFALEHWYYYLLIYAETNATYQLTSRCESELCPETVPIDYYTIDGSSKIKKEGDTSALGMSVSFNRLQLDCTNPIVQRSSCRAINHTVFVGNLTSNYTYNTTNYTQPALLPADVNYTVYTALVRNKSDSQDVFQNHWNPCGVKKNLKPVATVKAPSPLYLHCQ